MTISEIAYPALIGLAVVVLLGLGLVLLRRGRRGARPTGVGGGPTVTGAPAAAPDLDAPDGTTVIAPEKGADTDFVGEGVTIGEPAAPVSVVLEPERPEPAQGRLVRLRARLARSNSALGQGLLSLLSRDTLDQDTWDEIEETLLLADIGTGPAAELLDALRGRVAVLGTRTPQELRRLLREELLTLIDTGLDRSLAVTTDGDRPAVVLVVGVNGTGKTTTVGKLARVLVAQDRDVLLGAADTFRAAAADQLATWGEKVGVPTIRSDREGADPASVAFDAVRTGTELGADVVLIDTAGRLQNKIGLMDELGKIKRVVAKHGPVDEVLLVLDATTGQNGMQQAAVFSEVVDVTGIVLTKLDGTAKGGIVLAVQRQLGVPVKLVGLGEGPDDLAPFEPEAFVDALVE